MIPEVQSYSVTFKSEANGFEARLDFTNEAYLASCFETENEANAWISVHLASLARGPNPIRTICSICSEVLVEVEEDERGISHGLCVPCSESFTVADETPPLGISRHWRYGHDQRTFCRSNR